MSTILKGLNESTRNKYDNNRTGFSRGPRDDERHDLDVQKPTREEWALKINGKVWSKDGKTVTFTSKEKALKARQSLLAKRPELEVGLVTRSVSEAGTGLDIDRSIPGRTIARTSGTSPDPEIGKLRRNPHAKKLVDFHDDNDDYDQWSGKVDPSIHDDEEDTFDTDYTGDEDGALKEISNEKLAQYKTAAALDAGKADSEGDYKRADKRFSGIVKATKKQFANDTKTVKEDINVVYSKAKSLLTQLDENTQQRVINALTKSVDDEEQKPFKTGYPRVNNPKILGTQNRAKSAYHPPARPPIKKLDKPLPENLGNELKSKSLEALQQVKQQLEQQRMADLEQWEKDFKQNTVAKFTAREPNLRQRATSTPMVAMPGEKHSELKARLSQLDKAIEKQGILDNLVQKLDKKGLLTPNIEAGVDTSMLVRDGARDNYVELNKKLDKALEYVKNRLLTNKAAYAKPKAIDEDLFTAGLMGLAGIALWKFVDAWEESTSGSNSPIWADQREIEKNKFYVFKNSEYINHFRTASEFSPREAAETIKLDIRTNEHNPDTVYSIKNQGNIVFRFKLADADRNLDDFHRNFVKGPEDVTTISPQTNINKEPVKTRSQFNTNKEPVSTRTVPATTMANLPTSVKHVAKNNRNTNLDEDEKVSGRMRMNDYYDLADNIQEKLKQAIQMGDKARMQELNKQRDELDAHVKKHGMMPEAVDEEKQRLDPKCWTGYKKQGTKMKGGTRVNNCVPVKESSILTGLKKV